MQRRTEDSRGNTRWATMHRGLARMMLAAVVVQFYFAGLAAFGVADFDAHAVTGWSLILASILLVIFSALGRTGKSAIVLSGVVLAAIVAQPVLAIAPRATVPIISALHPVNALAIAMLLHVVSRRAKSIVVSP